MDGWMVRSGWESYSVLSATGPSHWAEEYETCAGKFQSPIDIEEHLVSQVRLPPLSFHGFRSEPISSTLTNNGHTGESSTVIMGEKQHTEDKSSGP
jgi:carbonic anhydrase